MKTDIPQTIRLADYRAPDYRILKTDLTFRLNPQATHVIAMLTIEATHDAAPPLQLDGEDELTPILLAVSDNGSQMIAGPPGTIPRKPVSRPSRKGAGTPASQ